MRISFFHTPKPRKYEYKPRFYNPETEEFEALKKKYESKNEDSTDPDNALLEYYKKKAESVREEKKSSFFGKKKVKQFSYQPRFSNSDVEEKSASSDTKTDEEKPNYKINLQRSRFYDDKLFAKPFNFNRMLIYIAVIVLLVLFIFW